MARKRKSTTQRGNFSTASSLLSSNSTLLSELEDRRLYYPDRARPARGLSKGATVIGISPVPQRSRNKGDRKSAAKLLSRVIDTFKFSSPKSVALCVRRHKRREVLFALKRSGKGSRSRRRRRNEFSDVSCR